MQEKDRFEEVSTFKYLGIPVTRNPVSEEETQARLMNDNRCKWHLSNMLKSKNVLRNMKIRVHKTVVRPIEPLRDL